MNTVVVHMNIAQIYHLHPSQLCVCVCVCGAKAGLDSGRWPFYHIFKRLSYEDLKYCCKRIPDAVEVPSDIGYCNQQGQKEHVPVQKVFQ